MKRFFAIIAIFIIIVTGCNGQTKKPDRQKKQKIL